MQTINGLRFTLFLVYAVHVTVKLTNMCTVSAPPPPPTNVIAESATMDNVSSIVVRWDPPNPVPDNLQYKVYFSAIDESGYQAAGEVVFRICDSTQTSASITDLSPRSRYQVRIGTVAGVVSESSSTPELIETPDISESIGWAFNYDMISKMLVFSQYIKQLRIKTSKNKVWLM